MATASDAEPPTINLHFEGYWREKKKHLIPAESGIYCAYTCIYSGKKQSCSPQKLVYVGAAENVREAIADHPGQADWESHIDTGEELCYSFAKILPEQCAPCAAALILKNKPPESPRPDPAPKFGETRFVLTGEAAFLAKSFTAG